ncbi:unnamed protein product [Owenia fusiformis]|uniref:Uncharacterized protein n=1 Tax=Owenia fusiformis TaxID=6347 RepID=A0A8J1TX49_OWEFU|nr:unnamed protein product [Owenia fusiformis]
MGVAGLCYLCLWTLLAIMNSSASEDPPRFLQEPEDTVAKPHGKVVLHCKVHPPSADVSWLYNGDFITSDVEHGLEIDGGRLHILSFKHTKNYTNHAGVYNCVANNSVGSIVSQPATLSKAILGNFKYEENRLINITVGNVGLIPCNAPKGKPYTQTVFEVNSTTIDKNTARYQLLPSGNLQVLDIRQSDQGKYRCIAINPITGQKKASKGVVEVKVISPTTNNPPLMVLPPKDQVVKAGENVTLECVVSGSPVPVVTWGKYVGELPEGRYKQVLGNLHIENVSIHDQDTYICRADNGVQPSKADVAFVRVLSPPVIEVAPTDQIVTEGETVIFQCHAHGSPKVHYQWLFNSVPLSNGDSYKVSDTKLTINNVQGQHAGMYQCVARNRHGQSGAIARLELKTFSTSPPTSVPTVLPDNITQEPSQRDVAPDSHLEPRVTRAPLGERKPNQGDNKVVMTTPVSMVTNMPEPTGVAPARGGPGFTRPRQPDSPRKGGRGRGNRRKNKKNRKKKKKPSMHHEERVNSNAKKVPPSKPTVSKLSDTSVKLEWTVPPNDGLKVTFFKVQFKVLPSKDANVRRDQHGNGWKTIDENIPDDNTMHEVTGLEPGQTYRFKIAAVYSDNDHEFSQTSAKFHLQAAPAHRPNKPSTHPVISDSRAISYSSIGIKWQFLPTDTEPVEGFYIYYKQKGDPDQFQRRRILGPHKREIPIQNLKADSDYILKLTAFNAGGESDFSEPVMKRTLVYGSEPEPFFPTVKPSPEEVDDAAEKSTQSSSEMLYMVLGIVLGVMMLLLVVFMVMCAYKQRQQRRMMAALDANYRSKFSDPSRNIHNDQSSYKKQNGFILNGLNGSIQNGGVNGKISNGHIGNGNQFHPDHMNINVNPMDREVDHEAIENENEDENTPPKTHAQAMNIQNSLRDVIQPPSPEHSYYNSIDRRSNFHPSEYGDTDSPDVRFNNGHNVEPIYNDPPTYNPPDYNWLSRLQQQVNHSREHINRSHDQMTQSPRPQNNRGSLDQINRSRDHIPRSFEQVNRAKDMNNREEKSANSKHKKRRRRPKNDDDNPLPPSAPTRDMATNTDLSSNEGTLDNSSSYRSTEETNVQTTPSPPPIVYNAPYRPNIEPNHIYTDNGSPLMMGNNGSGSPLMMANGSSSPLIMANGSGSPLVTGNGSGSPLMGVRNSPVLSRHRNSPQVLTNRTPAHIYKDLPRVHDYSGSEGS